jgi:hypothetical protein
MNTLHTQQPQQVQNQQIQNQQPPPQNELTTQVRHYIHYSNLVNNYNKQLQEARKLRAVYEDKIIHTLRANKMENAILQVSGATLQIGEEKSAPSLSLPRIEDWLHKYYKQRGNGIDETDSILRFIRLQKTQEVQTTACLKKTVSPVSLPPPPPPTPYLNK